MIASVSKRIHAARRRTLIVMTYPMILISVASLVLWIFGLKVAPHLVRSMEALAPDSGRMISIVETIGASSKIWGPLIPFTCLVLWIAMLISHRRTGALSADSLGMRMFLKIPWIGSSIRDCRLSLWNQLVSLFIESRIPLDEAIELSASVLGDRRQIAAAERAVIKLREGVRPVDIDLEERAAQPIRRLLIAYEATTGDAGGDRSAHLVDTLRRSADMHARRSGRNSRLAYVLLPALVTIFIGGGITLLMSTSMFGSVMQMITTLAEAS